MWAPLLALLALAETAPGRALYVHVVAPSAMERPSRAELELAVRSTGLLLASDLRLLPHEGEVARALASCEGKPSLLCWIWAARPDLTAAALTAPDPAARNEALTAARRHHGQLPEFVIVLTVHPVEGGARLIGLLLDVDAAAAQVARTGSAGEATEDSVFEVATMTRERTIGLRSIDADLERFLDGFSDFLRERAVRLSPRGQVRVQNLAPGTRLTIDEVPLGETPGAEWLLTPAAGPHTLVAEGPGLPRQSFAIRIEVGRQLTVSAALPAAESAPPIASPSVFYSGLGLAAAGAALVVYGAVAAPDVVRYRACTPAGDCAGPSAGFRRFPSDGDSVGTGPLVVPLGYSLALAGGLTAAGGALGDDEMPWSWIGAAAGLALGGLAYGLSEALNP